MVFKSLKGDFFVLLLSFVLESFRHVSDVSGAAAATTSGAANARLSPPPFASALTVLPRRPRHPALGGEQLVHADVFRPPAQYPMLFCVLVGTGVQLLCMGIVTIAFAAIG